jgi:1-aminocyclopropane-1-carboxylate deaminase/D-cysteine desulfhydrase-like pyridoxal-dependent ACC family enzyme
MDLHAARDLLARIPAHPLGTLPSPIEAAPRLRAALGSRPRLLLKRDDALSFAFGGNKVRKMQYVLAQALEAGADTLVTCGGVQSNHARVTAAASALAGRRCVLVANGVPEPTPTANALLDRLLGADVRYVASRDERAPAMENIAGEEGRAGRRAFIVPLGASTPRGALGFVHAVVELIGQLGEAPPPGVIVHASSSGGTQAGLLAGCRLLGLPIRILGISADEPADALSGRIAALVDGIAGELGLPAGALAGAAPEVDDRFVGEGYGVPTDASREAVDLMARTEAVFVDHTYTAKALAGLVAYLREGRFDGYESVLFWHTGGQVGIFA